MLTRVAAGAGILTALSAPLVALLYASLRVAHEEFYTPLGLTPDMLGLSQAGIVAQAISMVAFLGLIITTWAATGVLTYRLVAPLERTYGQRSYLTLAVVLLVSVAVLLLLLVALGSLIKQLFGTGVLVFWLGGAGPGAALGYFAVAASTGGVNVADQPNGAERQGSTARALAKSAELYKGEKPWMLGLVLYILLALALVWSIGEAWRIAPRAGERLRDKGELDGNVWYLDSIAAPARVIPKGGDPQKVCEGNREAVLVGRKDGTAYVVLLTPTKAYGEGELVSLPEADYAVVTGLQRPAKCTVE